MSDAIEKQVALLQHHIAELAAILARERMIQPVTSAQSEIDIVLYRAAVALGCGEVDLRLRPTRRNHAKILARQVVCYVLCEREYSMSFIADLLRLKDHTTVMYSRNKTARRMANDAEFARVVAVVGSREYDAPIAPLHHPGEIVTSHLPPSSRIASANAPQALAEIFNAPPAGKRCRRCGVAHTTEEAEACKAAALERSRDLEKARQRKRRVKVARPPVAVKTKPAKKKQARQFAKPSIQVRGGNFDSHGVLHRLAETA